MTHSLDRRQFLGLGALLTASGILISCSPRGGQPNSSAGDGSSTPRPGGEIFYLNAHLNPSYAQQQINSWHTLQVWAQFVEYLFYFDAAGKLQPHLATGYTNNDDFTECTITLRPGVTFSNGEKLDAESVALNLNLQGLGDEGRGLLRVANIPASYGHADAVGEDEVVVRFTEPCPSFIPILAGTSTTGILAPATLKLSLEEQGDLKNTYATGPFVVDSWVPNKEIVLARRDDYDWPRPDAPHQGPAYLEKITVQQLQEDSLRVGALDSGQVQVIHYTQPSEEQRLADSGFTVLDSFIPGSVWGLHIRLTAKHLDDVRVRQALTHAIDRQEIVDTLYSPAWKVAKSPLNINTPGAVDLSSKFAYDPDLANRLLDEAGWTDRDDDGYRTKNGEQLGVIEYPSVFITTSEADLQLIAQQWKRVGVKLELKNVDFTNYNTVTSDPSVSLYEIHWAAPHPSFLWRWWHSSQQNQFKAPSEELDRILESIVAARTDADAFAASARAQQYVIDNAYFIPVHEFPQNFAAAGSLKGISADGYGRIRLYDTWLDA
ncbi:MAG: ABC transporter substrate-binding protein [Mycobacterium sp.]